MNAGDVLAELDRVIIATRNQRIYAPEFYESSYLNGIEDGLKGFRSLVRSHGFSRIIKKRKEECNAR